jgi:DNA end-binding protein Ku
LVDLGAIAVPRPIWKGHISFGLVNVPVVLFAGERRADLSFRLIDSRNAARVRYERVNEETGEEVPWEKIVKGYEYEEGNYVLLGEEEMDRAAAEMTRTIEIEQFVGLEEIDIRSFEKPYVLVPGNKGEKGYVLLREAIAESGKAGIATVVIRTRQHLAALIPQGKALVLELLRFDQELVALDDFELPSQDLRKVNVTRKEIDLATKLIEGMTSKWDAAKFKDEYREMLMKLVEKKIAKGQTEVIESDEEEVGDHTPQTINFMDVLKRSVEGAAKNGRRRKSKSKTPRKGPLPKHRQRRSRTTKKKQAG